MIKGRAGRRRNGEGEEKDGEGEGQGGERRGDSLHPSVPPLCRGKASKPKKLMELLKKGIWNLPLGPPCQGIMVQWVEVLLLSSSLPFTQQILN